MPVVGNWLGLKNAIKHNIQYFGHILSLTEYPPMPPSHSIPPPFLSLSKKKFKK